MHGAIFSPSFHGHNRNIAVNAAPASVAIAKRLLWESVTETPRETMAKEKPLLAWVGKQPDAAEGVRSFMERQPPQWKLRASTDLPDWPEDVIRPDTDSGDAKVR